MAAQTKIDELDVEWAYLILTARKMGISIEEIRSFLQQEAGMKLDFSEVEEDT